MIRITTQFEFRLIGASAPSGELEADQLLAIVASLKEIASKLGRVETDAEPVGRAPKRTQRIAKLTIGLASGSTTVLARRTGMTDSLDLDLVEEQAFDDKFADLVDSIALDERPPWVGDSLSRAAADLTVALKQAAPEVEFSVAGEVRRRFDTAATHRGTWLVDSPTGSEQISFTGKLYAVNLKTHRWQVHDDVGHHVALPKMHGDAVAGPLLDRYVTVTGTPELDVRGRLTHIHGAAIEAAPDPLGGSGVDEAVSLDAILASAPGIEPGGIEGLTDTEFDTFFEAMGL